MSANTYYRYTTSESTGSVDFTVEPPDNFWLEDARIHLNAASTGTFMVYVDHLTGSKHDVRFCSQAMAALTDYYYQPTRPIPGQYGDTVRVTFENTSGKNVGVEVLIFY